MQKKLSHIQKKACMLLSAVLVVGGTVGSLGAPVQAASESAAAVGAPLKLTLMHTNDTHARLDSIAKRFTAIKQVRSEVQNSILLDAGDVFSGSLYFNKYSGLADVVFMNEIGYDAMVFGNHEFDKGPAVLADFVKAAKFPFVSSNLDFSKEAALSGLVSKEAIGKPAANGQIHDAIILEEAGQKIAVFGLTTEETKFLASPGENIVFENYIEKAKETVKLLQNEGINKIIALTHLGNEFDKALAEAVTGIDVIVGGHSHTKVEAPIVFHPTGEPTLVVQAEEYGNFLGRLDMEFNETGVLKKWDGKLLTISGYEADPKATEMLKTYSAGVEEIKKEVIGKTEVLLDGDRNSVRTKETNLGNLMADGMVAKVKSFVDSNEELKKLDSKGFIAIQNGGGIRSSIKFTAEGKVDGDITLGELLTMMPFGNNLTSLRMTGEEIVAALENGVSGVETGQGRFPQVSGLRFSYDVSKKPETLDADGKLTQAGERITKVEIKNADGSYSPIDPKGYYFVATNSFMANGGDFYRSMKQAKDAGRQYEMNLVDYEVFKEHITNVGTIKAAVEGRIIETKFTDTATHWAQKEINEAVKLGFVTGYTDGTFKPKATATRAEFVTMVGKAFKLEPSTIKLTVKDADQVPVWASTYVANLYENKIITGYEDNTFRPSNVLTRTEMTVILVKALGLTVDSKAKPSFDDTSSIPAWAQPYIAAAQTAGIVGGVGGNRFEPQVNATRADVVKIILSALEHEKSKVKA